MKSSFQVTRWYDLTSFLFPHVDQKYKIVHRPIFTNHWPYKNNQHQLKLGSKKYTGARPNHVSPWPNCYLINSYPVNCYSLNCCWKTIEKGKLLICFVCFGMSSQLQLTCWTSQFLVIGMSSKSIVVERTCQSKQSISIVSPFILFSNSN